MNETVIEFKQQIIEAREEHSRSWDCLSPHFGERMRTSLITKLPVT